MNRHMTLDTKTKLLVAAVVALAALGIAAPLALADSIGAPTSAAGGLSAPSSPSRPGAVGPLSGSGGSGLVGGGNGLGGGLVNEDYEPLKLQEPGTGKFEGPNNGTSTPCVGSTGFGSTNTQPGHKC